MRHRIATLYAPQDPGADTTLVIDIKPKDVISAIDIFFRVTNVTVSVMLDAVSACIPRIELIDGSDTILSLSGAELQAIGFYDRLVMPHHEINLTVGGFFEIGLTHYFGRYLWDEVFAFDPTRFKNPQLRIQFVQAACNTAGDVVEMSAYAHCFGEGGPVPGAMLINREVTQHTMLANTHRYPDLPTDRVIRKILLRGYSTDHDPIALFETIKLSADGDAYIPLEIHADMLERMLIQKYPRINEMYTMDGVVTAKTIHSALSSDQKISINYDVIAAGAFAVRTWTGALLELAASVATVQALTAEVSGRMPANCFPLDFGVPNEPDTWLKANEFGSLELDLLSTGDADVGDITHVVVQQVRPY